MVILDTCPPAVIERIETADLGSSENAMLFSWIASMAELECQAAAVPAVAERLTARSHPLVIDDFCSSVATYARFLPEGALGRVRAAYRRIPYRDAYAPSYFAGLRATGTDLRAHLKPRVTEDWSFTHPRRNAATWHYYLYLASLGETGALERLAEKIAATEYGNDVANLLASLAELKADGVDEVLRRYVDDPRTSDAPEGPGATVGELAQIHLLTRSAE